MPARLVPFFTLLAATLAGSLPLSAPAQEEGSAAGNPEEERGWLEYYYEKPTPNEFVARMREYSKEGTLQNENARPALIAFTSQLFRQNRDKIDGWYTQLRGLPPEEIQVLHTAMLYSRTSEADAVLKREFGEQFEKQKKELPKILELKLDQPKTIDMLWGFFYATGSESAVRRVIAIFNFADAPTDPEFAKIPEGFSPLYRNLPEAAAWTLLSNASRHPLVRKICRDLYDKKDALSPAEKRILKEKVLDELKPRKGPAN